MIDVGRECHYEEKNSPSGTETELKEFPGLMVATGYMLIF
jgi:hypothetical protein